MHQKRDVALKINKKELKTKICLNMMLTLNILLYYFRLNKTLPKKNIYFDIFGFLLKFFAERPLVVQKLVLSSLY